MMIWLLQRPSGVTVVAALLILSLLASAVASSSISGSRSRSSSNNNNNNKRGSVTTLLNNRACHHHHHHHQQSHHYCCSSSHDDNNNNNALLQRFTHLSSSRLRPSRLAFAATPSSSSRNNNNKRGGGGGGFGSSSGSGTTSSSSQSTSASSRASSKKNIKKRSSSKVGSNKKLVDLFKQQQQQPETPQQHSSSSSSNNGGVVLLDKWGLPPPTIEDIFPRMPPGTELIAARSRVSNKKDSSSSSAAYTRAEIQAALHNCLPLPGLSTFFDDNGDEQKPSTFIHEHDDDSIDDSIEEEDGRHRKLPMKLRLVHESPAVLVIDNFLSKRECLEIEQIIDSTSNNNNQQRPKMLEVGSALFSEGSSSSSSYLSSTTSQLTKRTSTSWFCEYQAVPQLLAAAQYVLGLNIHNMEEPQIVRYQTGQEFTWHYDQVPDSASLLANGGQRMATLLVYLNTVKEGGGTVFRDLKRPAAARRDDDGNQQENIAVVEDEEDNDMLTVQPVQGRACIFFPATFAHNNNNGDTATASRIIAIPDDRTLHKGQVAMDEKRIVQIWIHQDTYRATLPSILNRQEDAIPAIQQLARQNDNRTKPNTTTTT